MVFRCMNSIDLVAQIYYYFLLNLNLNIKHEMKINKNEWFKYMRRSRWSYFSLGVASGGQEILLSVLIFNS